MATERCRVCAIFNGSPHYYQRDTEQKRNGNWVAIPFFVPDPKQAAPMSEAFARHFVVKLQGTGIKGLWLEDCRDGRRIEVAGEAPQQVVEDIRTTATATLDDQYSPDARWFVVKPVNRPNGGAMWVLKCLVPGASDPQLIFEKHPLDCLQRAQDLNFLQYGERAPAPEPPAAPIQTAPTWRRRPGDIYGS
jgi:hypothetical protein